ncbi:nucleotide exchange factor GrpE [Salinirubellus salinus]|uniref:Protein GrpE n=1 Tax=Salinirubellus salinus TaxID=1364945 RepID=A0A9E7R5H6_9EURY|nr:nucleotide exchange factor GrpE [Salinirubellus salinus]UWM55030.1 nucleotide exchange factor GrpE [Salinirubellus salinus]
MSENEGEAADETPSEEVDPAENGASTAEAAVEPDPELVERIAEADPGEVAREVVSLRQRADAAEDALAAEETRAEELESKLKRKTADFQNYKKRMEKRREQEKARATEDLVERLVEVRDNLVRALEQDDGTDIRGGIEKTLETFDRVLDAENVVTIEPGPGEDVDPQRHEVLLRVDSDHPEGTVDSLQRPGYEMAGKVIRPAQVTVSDGA